MSESSPPLLLGKAKENNAGDLYATGPDTIKGFQPLAVEEAVEK